MSTENNNMNNEKSDGNLDHDIVAAQESVPSTSHSHNNTQPSCPTDDSSSHPEEPLNEDAATAVSTSKKRSSKESKSLEYTNFTEAQKAVVIAAVCVARDRLRRMEDHFDPTDLFVDSTEYKGSLYKKAIDIMKEPGFMADVGVEPRIPTRRSLKHTCQMFQKEHTLSRETSRGGRPKKELDETLIESMLDEDISVRDMTRRMPSVSFGTIWRRVNEIKKRRSTNARKKKSNKEVPQAEQEID